MMQTIVKFHVFSLWASCFLWNSTFNAAADIRTERVNFNRGSTATVTNNRIKGYETVDYVLRAAAEQRMMVVLETDNPSNYFNISAPGSDQAMHIGSVAENRFEAKLPASGDYTIRVYLMRNGVRRNESTSYSLAVDVFVPGTSVAAPLNDFADGFGGGPNFWEVTGVADGDALNLRKGPSTQNRILARFVNGEALRNRGCKMAGGQRWCKVEQAEGSDSAGWVAGRYLREATGPSSSDATVSTSPVRGTDNPSMQTERFRVPSPSVSLREAVRLASFDRA